jgi:general secretion pathway protein K
VENRNSALAPLQPQRIEQLVWLGLPPQTVAALEPYVTLLPESNARVNLNTASAEVIYAAVNRISLADAQRLVAERGRQHFRTLQDAKALLPETAELTDARTGVGSSFFEVRGRLRLDNVVIEERSVVRREGLEVRTLSRERGTSTQVLPTQSPSGR